jgi:hypothetical protein
VISRSALDPSGGQCLRMTTVITASVPVRTSDMRCSAHGARPLATRSARLMGVTRTTRPARPDGSAWLLVGTNTVGSMPSPAIPTQQDPRPGLDGRIKISREADEVILIERAGHDEDPPSPDNLPPRAFRDRERRHTPIRPAVRPGRGIQTTQLITRPPQLGLGQQPQVGLGPLVAHPPSLHLAKES